MDDWQAALGSDARTGGIALVVVPLDHGFTAPGVAVLTEQDMLGDRIVRRAKRKKSADAFLAELATLSPGDFVVHADHGIGLDGHEPVNLVRGETTPLAAGMCFSDEPGLYLPGRFGVRLEDCFHLTEAGPRWFSEPPRSIDMPV